ncbi:MAG: hypothetical protein WB565_01650 [Acidimicrobiales bacterium]
MIFRDFLYLDRPLVRTFLAQAEGGEYDETTQRQKASGKGGLGLKAGAAGLGASAEKSKESAQESETVIKQVAASEFDRFYTALEDDLPVLDVASDASDISGLKRQQFIEVDAHLAVAGIQGLVDIATAFESTASLMETFGAAEVDQDTVKTMQALKAFGAPDKPLPIIASVPGGLELKIALELDRQFISTINWDTDATILLKIQRFIRGNDRHIVGDPFGGLLKLMPEAERANFIDTMRSGDAAKLGIGEIEINAPAILATAVAIYR